MMLHNTVRENGSKSTFFGSVQSRAKWLTTPQLKHVCSACFRPPHLPFERLVVLTLFGGFPPFWLTLLGCFFIIFALGLKCLALAMFSKEGRTVSLCQTAFCLKLKMTRQVLEHLTALIVCHVKLHLFPRVKERTDHNLDLLLISQIIPSSFQLANHCWHFP